MLTEATKEKPAIGTVSAVSSVDFNLWLTRIDLSFIRWLDCSGGARRPRRRREQKSVEGKAWELGFILQVRRERLQGDGRHRLRRAEGKRRNGSPFIEELSTHQRAL